MECYKLTCTALNRLNSSKIVVWLAVSRKQIVGLLLFEETVTPENYPNLLTQFIAVLQRMQGIAGVSKMGRPPILRKQQLFCRTSCVVALSGVAFGHHDRQTLRHLTSFCGDFLKNLEQ